MVADGEGAGLDDVPCAMRRYDAREKFGNDCTGTALACSEGVGWDGGGICITDVGWDGSEELG